MSRVVSGGLVRSAHARCARRLCNSGHAAAPPPSPLPHVSPSLAPALHRAVKGKSQLENTLWIFRFHHSLSCHGYINTPSVNFSPSWSFIIHTSSTRNGSRTSLSSLKPFPIKQSITSKISRHECISQPVILVILAITFTGIQGAV